MTLMIAGVDRKPGMGTNTITLPTRADTHKKPLKTGQKLWIARAVPSAGISLEISEQKHRVTGQAHQHPRKEQEGACKKGRQTRHTAEGGILNRRQNLNEAYDDAHEKADCQQWKRQPECPHKSAADEIDNRLMFHFRSKS